MKRLASMMAAVAFAISSIFAASNYELGEIELGKTYTIPSSAQYGTLSGVFTATRSGALTMTGLGGCIEFYPTEDHAEDTQLPREWVQGSFGPNWACIYQVEENTTYYLYAAFVMLDNGNKLVFEMADDIEIDLVETYPQAGAQVNSLTNNTGEILLVFNTGVTYSNSYLEVGDTKAQASAGIIDPSRQLAISIKSALNSLYASGALSTEGGDQFTLCVEGIKASGSNIYGEDGTLKINFVNGGKLSELISTSFGNSFILKSYYPEGDPAGILEFAFDKDLKQQDGNFTLSIGNIEIEGAYYHELIPAVVSGNKVTVDLTGKMRDLNAYSEYQAQSIPGTEGIVAAQLSHLFDTNGNPVAGAGQGSYGSYTFNFIYDYIVPANIACEFDPRSGESLEGVDQIEIWFNNADALSFDGINFNYSDGSEMLDVVVPNDQLQIERVANECTILCPVPEQVKGKKKITVTLNKLVSLDGYDHTQDIRALYDQFVATLIAPITDGARIASTGNADFVVSVNKKVNYMRYDFYNGDEWYYGTQFWPQEDGTYTSYNGNYPCYSNVDNRMLVRVYASEADYWNGLDCTDSCEFHFIGTISPFVYSSYNFIGIDPAPNSTITNTKDFCFTLAFDGLAYIDTDRSGIIAGMGVGLISFEKIEPVNPEPGEKVLANTWKLYPGNSYMQSNASIDISVVAYDQNDFLIQGNMLEGSEMDYLQFSYTIESDASLTEVSVSPAAGEVKELSTFTITCGSKAVGLNYNSNVLPSIQAQDGSWSYYFVSDDLKVESDLTGEDEDGEPVYSETTRVVMTLPDALDIEGVYTLEIPEKAFMIGSQFDTSYNSALTVVYTILGNGSIGSIAVDTAPAYDVYTVAGTHVMHATSAAELLTLRPGIYIINGKKVALK